VAAQHDVTSAANDNLFWEMLASIENFIKISPPHFVPNPQPTHFQNRSQGPGVGVIPERTEKD
jgi:hypothetical protein